jgi:hypothetical protein
MRVLSAVLVPLQCFYFGVACFPSSEATVQHSCLPPDSSLLIHFELLGEHASPCPFMCTYKGRLNVLLSLMTAQQGSCSLLAVLGSEVVQVLHQCLLCPQLVGTSYHTLTR